jgi:hypothetical protein
MKVNLYYRSDNMLCQGRNFILEGNRIDNGCITHYLNKKELKKLLDGEMIMHDNVVVIPNQEYN